MTSNNSIAVNRKAKFDYFLLEKFEAGIQLQGCEVKSLREGRVNLRDSFVKIVKDEAFMLNCHISPYTKIQGYQEVDPTRTRKLLLKKDEIKVLAEGANQKGYAIIPVSLYFKRGLVKVEIALGRGKNVVDKRETIKRRIHDKETKAAIKSSMRKG